MGIMQCENCGAEAIGSILIGFDSNGKIIVKWLCLECIVDVNFKNFNPIRD